MPNKYDRHPVRVFFSYFAPHKKLFLIDMLCALLASAVDLIFPYVSKKSMEAFLPERRFFVFFLVMAILVVCYALKALLYYVITVVGHKMGTLVEADMRRDVFCHMQELSFSFFDKNRTGELLSRVTNDLFDITELAHHGPENLLICSVTILGAAVLMFTLQWKLALVLILILPILFTITMRQRVDMKRANLRVKKRTAQINAAIESGISGIRTAKAFGGEDQETAKFDRTNDAFKTAKVDFYKSMGRFTSWMEFTTGVMPVLVILVGGILMMNDEIDYVTLVTFSLYVATFISPTRKLAMFMENYMQGSAGFSRFLEIMRQKPQITDAPDAIELTSVKGEIRYDHVSFSYRENAEVLQNVSLVIRPGERFAFVGPSGSGKSTLCHLIMRFYEPQEGRILLDGADIRTLTQKSLRRQIGMLSQDVFLFAGSIRENIRYGLPEAGDEDVVRAACRAGIHEEILAMPDGYDTYVGERGVMLSGGQKQRVSIARVFLKNPPILILDEATSALDSVTEKHIQDALEELSKGRTTLTVAHRLSTVKDCDRIAVVAGGRIEELGSPAELIKKGGAYAALWNAQNGKSNA